MPRFTFALEPLLRTRKRDEQTAQRDVAKIERERLALETRIRRKQHAISEGKSALQDRLVGALKMDDLRSHAAGSLQLMRDAQRIVLELAGIHKRIEASRSRLLEASKRRRAVELLRERRHARWKVGQDRIERNAQDELAIFAAARKESDA